MISQKSSDTVQEVKINAVMEKDEKEEWILKVTLENETHEKVFIPELGGEWIYLRMDLWAFGKGIQLYSQNDAEWRRRQTFVNMEWRGLVPGEVVKINLPLNKMMSDDPDNDEVAKFIMDDFLSIKSGESYLNISYRCKENDPNFNEENHIPIFIRYN